MVSTTRVASVDRLGCIVIGAGHAGLAMSRCLSERSIDHVVLERGEVANSWRRERWDSLRLLTPNWQTRLPGLEYRGGDPDGYMTMAEVVGFIGAYAAAVEAPVETHTRVSAVRRTDDGWRVVTDDAVSPGGRGGAGDAASQREWRSRTVVLASGACNAPTVPGCLEAAPPDIPRFTPFDYGNPSRLPEGGVLVIGASATGVQLADEIHRSGRPVVLAVGEHVRMPRTYRGRDVLWWMEHAGVWDERYDQVDDIVRARGVPSPQLVGHADRATLDLNALTDSGVELVGRLATVRDGVAQFSGGLRNQCALADLKLGRLLDTFDEWTRESGRDGEPPPPERFEPTRVPEPARLSLDLASGEIRSIVCATGFRPDYGWLEVPEALDRKGRLRHEGGVVAAPGLYALGLPFLRRRKSSFICGAGDDAHDLAEHLAGYLSGVAPPPTAASRAIQVE